MRARARVRGRYIFWSDKHMFFRVMPYLISLMDSDEKERNVFRRKGLDLRVRLPSRAA